VQPPDPCRDLGYGAAAPGLVGEWNYTLNGHGSRLTLFENGTFVDSFGAGYPGFWGLADDGTLTVVYSLGRECPPVGTLMTATGVTETDTSIAGTVVSSPIGVSGSWSITR
jgi:hypothetical protein